MINLTGKTAGRRHFMKLALAGGSTIPLLQLVAAGGAEAAAADAAGKTGGVRAVAVPARRTGLILRDFQDPFLELMRLLREAAEIEHGLMIQYLYAAFSLKPAYAEITGAGDPNAETLLGVAIQEMQHLGVVNRLIVALGGNPVLSRQDFPYEPDIYPFPMSLEPLSRRTAAQYAYTEAPGKALESGDAAFISGINAVVGSRRPNHVGSLYAAVVQVLEELLAARPDLLPDPQGWLAELDRVRNEGEHDHFLFFKSLFEGTHPGFGGRDVWALQPEHPDYPALPLAHNPTAWLGHKNQIADEKAYGLAWLGNLCYWLTLLTLDLTYRDNSQEMPGIGVMIMQSALWPLARALPEYGYGLPYDPISIQFSGGRTAEASLRFAGSLAGEIALWQARLAEQGALPDDFYMDPEIPEQMAEIMKRAKTA